LYDIHGNLPALEAVLQEVASEQVDLIVVGGDVASGPMPAETLDRLRELSAPVRFVRGNADRELADAYERWAAGALALPKEPEWMNVWPAKLLGPRHRAQLARFEPVVSVESQDLGEILFCHATPRSDEEFVTRETTDERLAQALGDASAQLVVAGHVHMQMDRLVDGKRFVNAGSVGMPYEDEAGAYWLLLGSEVALRRTVYDYERAAAAIRATGYPDAEEMVQESLLEPIGSAEATRHFQSFADARREPFSEL
jgi:putative phosphoesterase